MTSLENLIDEITEKKNLGKPTSAVIDGITYICVEDFDQADAIADELEEKEATGVVIKVKGYKSIYFEL